MPYTVFPTANPGNTSVSCRLSDGASVIADGEQFPFGRFNSPVCACDHAPYELVFGQDVTYGQLAYHTFRLLPKPCTPATIGESIEVCSALRSMVNKIALRLDVASEPCWAQSSPLQLLDQAENFVGVRFVQDGKAEPDPGYLSARAGFTYSRRSIELYIYALRGPYTNGTFLLPRCTAVPTVRRLCKRAADGMCLYAFVDTPGHNYVTVCRAQGL